jgi:hypothetical protein
MKFDGKENLRQILREAGYSCLESAVASHCIFLHQNTVMQTQNRNLFRIVRDFRSRGNRGKVILYDCGSGIVMADDNDGPANAFRWAVAEFDA